MGNTRRGEGFLAKRLAAEDALRVLDPEGYRTIEHWHDKELYGGFFGHGGQTKIPASHKSAIMRLLRARAAVYRGRKTGHIVDDRGQNYDSEVGNEMMAQAIDNCLEWLGDGSGLPRDNQKGWDDFLPEAFFR